MIPENLHWAFEQGHRVSTLAGTGKTIQHRLADLILPSGQISTGYPGDNLVNEPNKVQTQVAPGTYPVFLQIVRNTGAGTFAFAAIRFSETKTITWKSAGRFFTDRGDGCIFDTTLITLLKKKRSQMEQEEWAQLKTAALYDGDGNLVLDESTGANAIIFKTGDWSYNCFVGHDQDDQIACLVIDGRIQHSHKNPF